MKCKITIDKNRDEEVLIYAHKRTALIDQIEELVAGEAQELLGYQDKNIVLLSPGDICCFSVENGRVYALGKEKWQLRQRLHSLEALLGSGFVKINQSCIANIKKIKRFDASIGGALLVTFENGHKDYVSRRQLKTVKERIGFTL